MKNDTSQSDFTITWYTSVVINTHNMPNVQQKI